jgi:hypothetical protein
MNELRGSMFQTNLARRIARSLVFGVLLGLGLVGTAPSVHAGLIDLPGLQSITFNEVTGASTPNTFLANSLQLANRLVDPLSSSNSDFNGLSNENYDVFYSNPDGTPNLHGNCVTIEAVYSNTGGGGGLNIAEVGFNFGSFTLDANAVCSAVYNGPNSILGSAANAVDGNPATFSTMGSTPNYPNDPTRLRLTVTLTPEPSTLLTGPFVLILVALFKLGRRRRRLRLTSPQ